MSKFFETIDHAQVEQALRDAIARAPDDVVRAGAVMHLAAHEAGWEDTGLVLARGEAVSLLSRGVVWMSRALDLGVEGKLSLWYRVGDGPIAKAIDSTTSFVADRDGPLMVIARLAGQWIDETGRFDPASTLEGGALCVAAVVWKGTAAAGLPRFAAGDATGLAASEAARIPAARPVPRGWGPLWRLGQTAIFCEAVEEGAPPHIACRCRQDAGILKYPLDVPLAADVELAWDWRIRQLPSLEAEDSVPTHDYLSIAVEFDNGQDVTYFWSSSLPVGTTFRCPLPGWDKVETHIAVRSGHDGLGAWTSERRPVLADYRAAVGGPDPARIVGVWLIAVSAFQRGEGVCDFARIRLDHAGGEVKVAPWAPMQP
ncbi:DUF3047 domain-containing protein [Xanthobacter autotrophicus]|uniref:DUF3047 domain-containing protein n=1 Tax=Xanthobacter autotrophicus TaxID=280 RepID=UPI00372910BB